MRHFHFHLHPAQHPNNNLQHGIGLKAARRL